MAESKKKPKKVASSYNSKPAPTPKPAEPKAQEKRAEERDPFNQRSLVEGNTKLIKTG